VDIEHFSITDGTTSERRPGDRHAHQFAAIVGTGQ
jgi:hypothetical protein